MKSADFSPEAFRADLYRYANECAGLRALAPEGMRDYRLRIALRRFETVLKYLRSRQNTGCSNCGSILGGPMGHETSECNWSEDLVQRARGSSEGAGDSSS